MGAEPVPGRYPGGAALVAGDEAWVLLGPQAPTSLGGALAFARRDDVPHLHVVVDDAEAAGLVARRAHLLARPPTVWRVEGTDLVPADAAPPPVPLPVPDAPELRGILVAAGLRPVDEDGVTLGELLGLEVARITHGPEGPELSVGVGRFDRELGALVQGHLTPAEQLARVAEVVGRHRRPGARPHPLNQLVPERWLRSALVDDPALVGVAALAPAPSVVGRANLLEGGTATAVGTDLDGSPVVVTCSTGVDVDLVPSAADDRAALAPEARLVLAVPARDALPLTRDLAAALAAPAEVVPVEGEWRIPWSTA